MNELISKLSPGARKHSAAQVKARVSVVLDHHQVRRFFRLTAQPRKAFLDSQWELDELAQEQRQEEHYVLNASLLEASNTEELSRWKPQIVTERCVSDCSRPLRMRPAFLSTHAGGSRH